MDCFSACVGLPITIQKAKVSEINNLFCLETDNLNSFTKIGRKAKTFRLPEIDRGTILVASAFQ